MRNYLIGDQTESSIALRENPKRSFLTRVPAPLPPSGPTKQIKVKLLELQFTIKFKIEKI